MTEAASIAGHPLRAVATGAVALVVVCFPLWLWWTARPSAAAFADREVLENNHLGAATLDVQIGDDTVTFKADNLAPGDVVSGQLELVNAGSLPLAYWVSATTDGGSLVDWLSFDAWASAGTCRPTDPGMLLASGLSLAAPTTSLLGSDSDHRSGNRRLAVGDSERLCLAATLPLTAPNSMQGQRLDVELVVHAEHDLEADR